MTASWKALWTIGELEELAGRALAIVGEAPANGRVRAIPDQRTIRYYTTLGLIDRPAAMQGRTAFYGRRHLLQLLAIKRLQARGLSLAALQQQLLAQPDGVLEELAQLPAALAEELASPAAPEPPSPTTEAFWKRAPAAPPAAEARSDQAATSQLLQGVPLGDDLVLLLSPARPFEPDDLEAIRAVAAPLRMFLQQRRLWQPRSERSAP